MGAAVGYRSVCPFPSGQVRVVWRPDYQLRFEYVPNTGFGPPYTEAVFGHVNVKRWNKTVRKNLLRDCDMTMKHLGMPVFVAHDPSDTKHLKFIKLLKFQRVPDLTCVYDGKEQEVWIRFP